MKNPMLSGLISAPFTPMNADTTVNVDAIPAYADFIAAKGCVNGVFVCGTSGESVSLTTEERKAVAAAWVKAAAGRFKVIVHVGGMSQPQCVELAAHAQEVGADMIAAMPPCFFKPANVQTLIDFLKPVAAAAPQLPFFYYHMPSLTGVYLPVPVLLSEGGKQIPTLRGVKFTHNDLMEMQMCLAVEGGRYEVLNGFDEILIAGVACGCLGGVGSTYNYVPGLYQEILDASAAGDMDKAREASAKVVKIIEVLIKHGGGTRAGKIFMKLAGFDCGPCRLPIAPCSDQELEQTRQELEQTDFFKYAK